MNLKGGEVVGATPVPGEASGNAPEGISSNVYAAIDLGTNNCRLLIATPAPGGFKVIDAFSRTVGLGERIADTGEICSKAIDRAVSALRICARKIERNGVTHVRAIATEACRRAGNGDAFIRRIAEETGITFDIISAGEEARLAAAGCAALADPGCTDVLVFDIGGGSTELIWLDLTRRDEVTGQPAIAEWASLPCGVVTLTDRFQLADTIENADALPADTYRAMVEHVDSLLTDINAHERFKREGGNRSGHLLGTSGTVTTIAGIALGLKKYDRNKVDGTWLHVDLVEQVSARVAKMTHEARARHPCIGRGRAGLIVAGCAILDAIHHLWSCDRLRVADRGLREGVLIGLMAEEGDAAVARERVMGDAHTPPRPQAT